MYKSYLETVLNQLPRLLGLLDRCEISDSYGCFDREFWKYKNKNFSNARLQEAAFTLCLLFFKKLKNNPFYCSKEIKRLSLAACNYWADIQRRDGSFDEYIANEKSHVATVFSSYCIAHCCYMFKLQNQKVLNALKKAAEWININDDLEVTNHDAGSIPFFYLMYKITYNNKYIQYLNKKLKKVLANQDEEGWFKEYGGADIGYQTYTIYYLAKYYSLSKDKSVLGPLEKATKFFSYFIHPDGTIGGLYGSRSTNFVLPGGFELLKNEIPLVSTISKKIKESMILKKTICPSSLDDRFIAEGLYTYLDFNEKQGEQYKTNILPYKDKDFKKIFMNAGLYVTKVKEHYLIINLVNGGIGKIFIKNKLQKELLPYFFKKKNKIYSTYGPSTFNIKKKDILINGNFYVYPIKFQTPLISLTLGIINQIGLGKFIKRLIRKRLIHQKEKTKYSFGRTIELKKSRIYIKDNFKNIDQKLPIPLDYSPIYSTSTQFVSYNRFKRKK